MNGVGRRGGEAPGTLRRRDHERTDPGAHADVSAQPERKDHIVALYADFLSKLDFNVKFEVLEVELGDNLGFVRTQSVGTIVPKGQTPKGTERNREVFVVKRTDGAWKIYRYIFTAEV